MSRYGVSVFDDAAAPAEQYTPAPSGSRYGVSAFTPPPEGQIVTTDGRLLGTPGTDSFVRADPLTARSMDEATDMMSANMQDYMARHTTFTNVIGTVGRALQPFAAPQQLIFAGVKGIIDGLDGDDETNAWETLKRGGRSALSYATYGGYQAAGLGKGDPRAEAITGYELLGKLGAPNWVKRWGGTALDFFVDVPLVGAAAKASKVDKLTAGLKIGENMARNFDSPAALRAFAGGVAAAPFTTQPIKRLTEAVPRGLREDAKAKFVDPVMGMRQVPRDVTQPVTPTLGQTWVKRHMGMPEDIAVFEERKAAVMSQFAVLENETTTSLMAAVKGLGFEEAQKVRSIMGKLADESSPAARAELEGQLRALETASGSKGLYDRAIRAVNKGIQFDHFGAEKLHAVGLMSEEKLKAVTSGQQRHLRRVIAMYGERGEDQIRRLMDRGMPARVMLDPGKLENLYARTLNATPPKTPPGAVFGKTAPRSVAAAPGRHQLLDPVAELERPVWRTVTEEIKIGTVDRGALDLPDNDLGTIRTLKNVLGEAAVQKVGGKWRVTGGVSDQFPVGHPDIVRIFGDLESQGIAKNVTLQERRFQRQVPAYHNPKDDTPVDVQREYALRELEGDPDVGMLPQKGALYIKDEDLPEFLAGASDAEQAAVARAMERFSVRSQNRKVGKGEVEELWLPLDPTDPDMARLLERARGGSAALFDGATNRPYWGESQIVSDKLKASLPSPKEFADAVQKAYTNPDVDPFVFLRNFFHGRGMTAGQVSRVLEGVGRSEMEELGIQWRPADATVARAFMKRKAAADGGGPGARGDKAVTTERMDLDEAQLDVLGEVEDFAVRVREQARVTSKAVATNGFIQDIRKYLADNDLVETVDTADMGSIYKTAGLRIVNAELARKLGNGFKEGEAIPAEIHRILWDEVNSRQPATGALLAWQWYSSRWQGVKLANPASIMTNLKSTFVMADQMGHSPAKLARGMADYLRLHQAAMKGDGAMDTTASVNGVTMRELFDHGAFTHNTMMNSEVVQQSNRLLDELANPGGDTIQRSAAAIQRWLTETQQGARAAQAYGKAVAPVRWLGDMYGRVDSLAKGGLYMSLRREGMAAEQAAKVADETFFNYNTGVPYAVDAIRKLGLVGMPFVSFKFLAAGRFFRSMYLNPYGVQRYYRLPNSTYAAMRDQQSEDGENEFEAYAKGAPDYIRGGLYIPLGKDSLGRHRAVRMDDILPETAVFDAFNADGVAGTVPPAIQLAAQIVTGKGYQNRDVYRSGEGFADTWRLSKEEAARGVVKALWQFGAYPWMPGQPMTERLTKAIADKSVPVEHIQDPAAQAVLKVLSEGPAAAIDRRPFAPERQGSQPVPDVVDALARILGGYKAYPVSTDPGEPGSARSNLIGKEMDLQTLSKMLADEMKYASTPEQKQDIIERYKKLMAPHLKKLRQ